MVTAHANATPGAYQLVATAGDATASFDLTNLPAPSVQLSAAASCSAFSSGTAVALSEIGYSVKKGKVNSLGVGTFSYWMAVTAVEGSNTVTVDQSITTGNFATLFGLASGSNVYRSGCNGGVKATFTQTSTDGASGTVSVTFTAAAAGTYYVNVKLAPNELKGAPAPTSDPVHYVFAMSGIAGSEQALDLTAQ